MNVIVVAPDTGEAERLARDLAGTGKDVLVLDALGGVEKLPDALTGWRPEVLVVHRDLAEEVKGLQPRRPILVYDPGATADEIADVLLRPPAPPPSPPGRGTGPLRARYATVLGLQGAYGGAGTTTVACAIALAARERGLSVAVLDAGGGDCAITLAARPDEQDPGLAVGHGVVVVVGVPPQPAGVWAALTDAYDLVVVDGGVLSSNPALIRFLIHRQGVPFYLVGHADRPVEAVPPGYGFILNGVAERGAPWWQQVDARFPHVEGLTERVNAGRFHEPSPLLAAARMFVERLTMPAGV